MKSRIAALDGLRGVAALIVVLSHWAGAMFPALPLILGAWYFAPLQSLYDGDFAVSIFFVLSGVVIANSAAGTSRPLSELLLARYVRLSLPLAASVFFAGALLWLFPHVPALLQAHVVGAWVHSVYNPPDIGLSALLRQAAGSVYLGQAAPLNPPLWTMRTELVGSCALYVFYNMVPRRFHLRALLLACLFLVPAANYLCFPVGAIFRELWVLRRTPRLSPPAMLLGALALVPLVSGALHIPDAQRGLLYAAAASLMVYAVLSSPRLQGVLATAPGRFLGRISFPLYLTHFPLLFTLGALVFLRLGASGTAALALLPVFLAAAFAVAYLGARLVDEPLLRLIRRMGAGLFVPGVVARAHGRKARSARRS